MVAMFNEREREREREKIKDFEKTTMEVTVIQFYYGTSLIYTYAYFRRGIIGDRVVPFGTG